MSRSEPSNAIGSSTMANARRGKEAGTDWLSLMLGRKPVKLVAVALANRMARVVWALIRSGESYQAEPA
jgi:transposase